MQSSYTLQLLLRQASNYLTTRTTSSKQQRS